MGKLNNLDETFIKSAITKAVVDKPLLFKPIYEGLLMDWCNQFEVTPEQINPGTKFFISMMAKQFVILENKILDTLKKQTPSIDYAGSHDMKSVEREQPKMAGGY